MTERKLPPRWLDKFSASPVGDRAEYRAAFAAAKATYPDVELGYIGTDGAAHYFQKLGEPLAYLVPVSDGWKPKASR
jgi:hypothetical protein